MPGGNKNYINRLSVDAETRAKQLCKDETINSM